MFTDVTGATSSSSSSSLMNPLYTSIPIIQRVMSFTPAKKLSTPLKLAQVCSTWEETCKVYGGGALVWLHEAEKLNKKSTEKLVSFFHRACGSQRDVSLWVVKQFLQLGIVDPTAEDRAGFQGIHFAVRWGNRKVTDVLLFHHLLYPGAYEERQRSSLLQGQCQCHDQLKQQQQPQQSTPEANPKKIVSVHAKIRSKPGFSMLDIAAETGQTEMTKHLISNRNFDVLENPSILHSLLTHHRDSSCFDSAFDAFITQWKETPRPEEKETCLQDEQDDGPTMLPNDKGGKVVGDATSTSFCFLPSCSSVGFIETNQDDIELARIISRYDTKEAIRNIKRRYYYCSTSVSSLFLLRSSSSDDALPNLDELFLEPGTNNTLLLTAAKNSRNASAERLLTEFSSSPLRCGSDGTSVLSAALRSCHVEIATHYFAAVASLHAASEVAVVPGRATAAMRYLLRILESGDRLLHSEKCERARRERKKSEEKCENDDDAGQLNKTIRLEERERLIHKRLPITHHTCPNYTPFLVAISFGASDHTMCLAKFLVDECGADPAALVIDDDDEESSSAENQRKKKLVEQSGADALDVLLGQYHAYSEQNMFLQCISFLVSVGCDADRRRGNEGMDFYQLVDKKAELRRDVKLRRTTKDNMENIQPLVKQAVQVGMEKRNERGKTKFTLT